MSPLKLGILCVAFIAISACRGQSKQRQLSTEKTLTLEEALSEKGLKLGSPIFIRAFKEERQLELFVRDEATEKYQLFRTYRIAAASGKLGPKLAEGDRQVPEGFYYSTRSSMNPNSTYHLSFNIGFPNAYDRAHQRTGSYIMIHGSNISIGCLAMTDQKIEEIYAMADAALTSRQKLFRIHIFPFRMTNARMKKAKNNQWIAFWKNLKTGYDHFEENGVPPNVEVENKRYTFEKQ